MRADLPGRIPLVCLACRQYGSGRPISLYTLDLERTARAQGDHVLDGVLRCRNPECGKQYPIVDGVAIIHPDPAALAESDPGGLYDLAVDPAVVSLVGRDLPDGAALSHHLQLLSIYLDAHWGDRASPPVEAAGREVLSRVAARAIDQVELAVELGGSVGRASFELSAGAAITVCLDQSLAALRRARRLAAGEPVAYARRTVGRHYRDARVETPPAPGTLAFICGDALDPPLVPGAVGRLALLSLLDVVVSPPRLLDVATALCRPGGELLVSSPYAWQSGHVAEDQRLGGDDPAGAVVKRLAAGGFTVEDEAELPWVLRRDDRSSVAYKLHYLRARRATSPEA